MEAGTLTREQRPRQRPKGRRSAFDDALIKAKIENRTVEFVLPFDLPLPDGNTLIADEGAIAAKVCHVDTYAVQFDLGGRKVWVSKAFLVAVFV